MQPLYAFKLERSSGLKAPWGAHQFYAPLRWVEFGGGRQALRQCVGGGADDLSVAFGDLLPFIRGAGAKRRRGRPLGVGGIRRVGEAVVFGGKEKRHAFACLFSVLA